MLDNVQINNNIYRILNAGCDVYLIDCKDDAVLIDCGCCKEDIRAYAESLIRRPVPNVITTHSHIDHCGKCGLFDHVYMTETTYRFARNPMDEDPAHLDLDYVPLFVKDYDELKIGNHLFEIILCDIHAPGNIMILDINDRILFTGDEIDADQVLLLPGFAQDGEHPHSCNAATVYEYRNMLQRIKDSYEDRYDLLCTGHNGSPLLPDSIDKMIALCDEILSGKKGKKDCSSKTYGPWMTHFPYDDAHYLRYDSESFSLVYCEDDLYERKNNSRHIPATPLHEMCTLNCKN